MADTMLCPHQSATTPDSALRSQRVWATLLLQLQAVPHPLVGKAHIPTTADSLVAHLVAHRLADLSIPPTSLLATCHDLLQGAPSILTSTALDLHAYCSRSAEETDYAAIFYTTRGFWPCRHTGWPMHCGERAAYGRVIPAKPHIRGHRN